jgi:hypothetical protein
VAKLRPPPSLVAALDSAEAALTEADNLSDSDLCTVPYWVRRFFHPDTLREALRFAEVCRRPGNEFLMACFLGILHHQRPGFLSYPSSHLVPYLRDKKYTRSKCPEMYAYRALRPRLIAKIHRSYRRFATPYTSEYTFRQCAVQHLNLPPRFDAVITSPPYMNTLDYGRDNRLRLWFIDPSLAESADTDVTQRRLAFIDAMKSLARKVEAGLRRNGYCVLVVGEECRRRYTAHPSEVLLAILKEHSPSLRLRQVVVDDIPDVRRTRRECRGVKREHFLICQSN